MNAVNDTIRFDNVSKFYGEVLGVNKVSLMLSPFRPRQVPPGA